MKVIGEENFYGIEDVIYGEDVDCEHCGRLEPFQAALDDSYTHWCLSCAAMNDNFILTPDESKAIEIIETEKKISYYQKCLDNLHLHLKEIKNKEK